MTFDAGAIEARLILDKSQFTRDLATAKTEGKDFEKNIFEATARVKNDEALRAIAEIKSAADALRTDLRDPDYVSLSTGEAMARITALQAAFDGLRGNLSQDINVSAGNLGNVSNQIQQALGGNATTTASVTVDPAEAQAALEAVQLQMAALKAYIQNPVAANISVSQADQRFDTLFDKLAQLSAAIKTAQELNVDNSQALDAVAETQAAFFALRLSIKQSLAGDSGASGTVAMLRQLGADLGAVSSNSGGAAGGLNQVGDAAEKVGRHSSYAHGWLRILTNDVQLWGGAFGDIKNLGSIGLWHIALDGLIEVGVVAVATTAALGFTLKETYPIFKDLYTNIMSMNTVAQSFHQSLGPINVGLSQLQQNLRPGVIELYGGALQLLGNQSLGYASAIQSVVSGFDNWIAKLDLFEAKQGHTGKLLQTGSDIMGQLSVILDNLGVAFTNFLKSDPGTVHYLLDLAEAGAKLITIISQIPTPLLYTALALHSVVLWGGLLATGLTKLLEPLASVGFAMLGLSKADQEFGKLPASAAGMKRLRTLAGDAGTALGTFGGRIRTAAGDAEGFGKVTAVAGAATGGLFTKLAGLASSPWTWAIVGAAAIGAIAYEMTQADAEARKYITDINTEMGQLKASDAISAINVEIGGLNDKIAQVPGKMADVVIATGAMGTSAVDAWGAFANNARAISSLGDVGRTITDLGRAAYRTINLMFSGEQQNAQLISMQHDTSAFTGEIVKLNSEQHSLFQTMGNLTSQGYSYAQSMAIMDLAGVKATDRYDVMNQKIQNLIKGYQEMGVNGGMLTNALDAVTLSSELQSSKITQLTGAYATFFGLVASGSGGFLTFEASFQKVQQSAGVAGSSMTGLNSQSIALRTNFDQAAGYSQKLYSALVTQNSAAGLGAKGTALLTRAGKDLISQLADQAGGSKEAQAQLFALAQIVGGPAVTSMQALHKWLGNVKNPAKDLDGIVGTLSVDVSNLATDMDNLSNAVSQNLTQAMGSAILQASGGKQAFDAFATAAEKPTQDLDSMATSSDTLASTLLSTLGNVKNAHTQFITFASALHLSGDETNRLWDRFAHEKLIELAGKSGTTRKSFMDLATQFGVSRQAAQDLWTKLEEQKLVDLAVKAGGTKQSFIELGKQLGLTKQQVQDVYNEIHGLPKNTPISVTETGKGTFTVSQQKGQNIPGVTQGPPPGVAHGATGMIIPGGYGGGDSQLIMAEPGETLLPKEATRDPLTHVVAQRYKVPGFATGGIVPSYGGNIGGLGPWTVENHNAFVAAITNSMEVGITAAANAAQSKAQAAADASAKATSGSYSGPGTLTAAQIEGYWTGAGGPGGQIANIMQAITVPESGRRPSAVQAGVPYGQKGWGLWQITPGNSEPQAGIDNALLNPHNNAIAAVAKYRSQGLGAWTTYTSGKYLPYLTANISGRGQHGMVVPGGYGGGDSKLIMAEPGETILPKEATRDPLTHTVAQKYRVPGFQSGGVVPGDNWLGRNLSPSALDVFRGPGSPTGTLGPGSGGTPGLGAGVDFTQVDNASTGGFGITSVQLGLPAQAPSGGGGAGGGGGDGGGGPTPNPKPKPLTATQKAIQSVLEKLMGGYIWHNKLATALQDQALLKSLAGDTKFDTQLSEIKQLDDMLFKKGKVKLKLPGTPGKPGSIPSLGTTLPPLATMEKYFGGLADSTHETRVEFAGNHNIEVNKVLASNARSFGDALVAAGYKGYIRRVGGFRSSKGASGSPIPYSMHQFGAAIDINEDGGPNGNWHTMVLPKKMVQIARQYDWFSGENWGGGSRDGGHFQYMGGGGIPGTPSTSKNVITDIPVTDKKTIAAVDKLLATFGVHVFKPQMTLPPKVNQPKAAAIKELEKLIKGDIRQNDLKDAWDANAMLKSLGVNTYGTTLSKISNLDVLLNKFKKAKDTASIKATETLLSQLGVKKFDLGGPLPPGAHIAINNTGRTETVTTASGMDALVDRFDRLIDATNKLVNTAQAAPRATATHLASSLNSTGHNASTSRRYPDNR